MRDEEANMGKHRWMRGRWPRTFPALVLIAAVILAAASASGAAADTPAPSPYQLTGGLPAGAKLTDVSGMTPRGFFVGHVEHGIPDVDTVPNFSGHFNVKGLNAAGQVQNQWETNTVGTPPQQGGTTTIDAPIIPVTIQLLNPDGSVFLSMSAAPYETLTANSPIFSPASWSSSPTPTELPDAIQRAEFYSKEKADWHTELAPVQDPPVVLREPYGEYYYQLNSDSSCCEAIYLNVDNTFINNFGAIANQLVNDGTMTTSDITTFLFPNTLLYQGSPQQVCCSIGLHSYFYADVPSGPQPRLLFNISSWFTQTGFLPPNYGDVEVLSHEMAETFNDPFDVADGIHGLTPWWLSANGVCEDDMEVGDVIENLPDADSTVTMNGYTYHIQNVALRQWFDTGQPSDALGGAYSYPDTTVLTSPATFQNVNCSP
jgi:hypothetical protein